MIIKKYSNLYVGSFPKGEIKIILSRTSKLVVDGAIMQISAEDFSNGCPVLLSTSNHIKPLRLYVNRFGNPKKKIPEYEKDRQKKVLEKVKELRYELQDEYIQ